MLNVLIVEDHPGLANSLTLGLREEGMAPRAVHLGREAIAVLDGGAIDLVVLDLGLPDVDGLDVLQHMQIGRAHV